MPARPDLLAFLRAVKGDPDDDTTKLVLADWLEEQPGAADRALGEYVRLTVASHRTTGAAALAKVETARQYRIGELWKQLAEGPWRPLAEAGLLFDGDTAPLPEYGGLVTVRADARALLAPPARALVGTEALAWVGALWVDHARARDLDALSESPLVEAPVSVVFGEERPDLTPAVCRFIRSPRLGGLRGLHPVARRGGRVVEAIAANPGLARLRALGLGDAALTDGDLAALLAVPHLGALRELQLARNRLTAAAGGLLADAPCAAGLTWLYLSGNRLGDAGAEALIASTRLPRRLRLDLQENGVSRRTAERLRRRFGRSGVNA